MHMDSHVVDFQLLSYQFKNKICEWIGQNDVKLVGMDDKGDVKVVLNTTKSPRISETFTRK